jgi:hypothetical protein
MSTWFDYRLTADDAGLTADTVVKSTKTADQVARRAAAGAKVEVAVDPAEPVRYEVLASHLEVL